MIKGESKTDERKSLFYLAMLQNAINFKHEQFKAIALRIELLNECSMKVNMREAVGERWRDRFQVFFLKV